MRITADPAEMGRMTTQWSESGATTVLIPTMGALHEGHLSLVRLARAPGRRVVVSIFVNPSQFGPGEDFERYPRDPRKDSAMLEDEGVDAVFMPSSGEIYPDGFSSWVQLPSMENVLCGRFRPGHFRGVATVCCILFGIVKPSMAVFGRKDAQQLAIIRRMVSDLRMGIEIVGAPILRESDGLAMSSRNAYLTVRQREDAARIFTGLSAAAARAELGSASADELRASFVSGIEGAAELKMQYADLVDPSTLAPMSVLDRDGLLAVAVHAGSTRLIDNVVLRPLAGAVEV